MKKTLIGPAGTFKQKSTVLGLNFLWGIHSKCLTEPLVAFFGGLGKKTQVRAIDCLTVCLKKRLFIFQSLNFPTFFPYSHYFILGKIFIRPGLIAESREFIVFVLPSDWFYLTGDQGF